MSRIRTAFYRSAVDNDTALMAYDYFENNIQWEDGVRTRTGGVTRKAKPMNLGDDDLLDNLIFNVLNKIGIQQVFIVGIYLNYYRDGNDYTPTHSHPGMKQVVISLGTSRVLTMGKGQYTMNNGDVIIFGSSQHGVPKDPMCSEGRISIALFLLKDPLSKSIF